MLNFEGYSWSLSANWDRQFNASLSKMMLFGLSSVEDYKGNI